MPVTDPEVVISAGRIRGRTQSGVAVFRGIPFAAPPVGELRFQAPVPPAPWDGVRDAASFGPPAPQPLPRTAPPGAQEVVPPGDSAFASPPGAPREGRGIVPPGDSAPGIFASPPGAPRGVRGVVPPWDNSLTVNVWTPDLGASGLPVMVWIHGGAYMFGSAAEPGYDGRNFAMAGVVMVSANHRLGVEGFAQIPGVPANRGLLDQVAVLRWVRDNISAFGGDPGNVTVFGESAGAGSIAALLAMDGTAKESTKGLFRRAIAQSVPGTFFGADLADEVTRAIAAEAGVPASYEGLSAADPADLAAASARLAARLGELRQLGPVASTITPFSPVVDGEVLPRAPWRALLAGVGRDVELLTGHNADECRLFVAMAGQLGKVTEGVAAATLTTFGPGADGSDRYRETFADATPGELHELVQTDWLFRMPTLHLAQAHAASGGRTFLYELRAAAPANGGVLGACHGLDVPLLFGTGGEEGIGAIMVGPEPSAGFRALGDLMREEWTRFARSGDPGWPAYGTEHRTTRIYDLQPDTGPYPEEKSMNLWQRHQFDTLHLTG